MLPAAVLAVLALVAAGCGGDDDDDSAGGDGGGGTAGAAASRADTQAAVAALQASSSDSTGAGNVPGITVQALGKAEGKPDLITVSMGVEVNGASANEALDQSSVLATALIETFKKEGVDEKDLQTSDLSIWPNWDDESQRIVGYHVSNTLNVKLRDLERAGAIIDVAAGAVGDAVRLNGVSFSIDDTTALLAEARADAVKQAADQAAQLAEAAGVELGELRAIDETGGTSPTPLYYGAESLRAADQSVAVPIEEGTQELTVSVVLVYDIAR